MEPEEKAPEDIKVAKLTEWHAAAAELAAAKPLADKEMALRKEVMALYFPTPVEGVNNAPLAAGWTLKATHKLDRKIDNAALPTVRQQLREQFQINPDNLFRTKYELETAQYKALKAINAEAFTLLETALIIKPASPTIELVAPKKKESE